MVNLMIAKKKENAKAHRGKKVIEQQTLYNCMYKVQTTYLNIFYHFCFFFIGQVRC